MSRIKAEVQGFLGNEARSRDFMNLYRYVKTIALLNTLYMSDAIDSETLKAQTQLIKPKLELVKKNLKDYDLQRFAQLWGIDSEYSKIDISSDALDKFMKTYSQPVVRLSNILPRINDCVADAQVWQDLHQQLAMFTIEIRKMRESEKGLTGSMVQLTEEIIKMEATMSRQHKRLTQPLKGEQKELLKELLAKFGVEFQKAFVL